VIRNYIAGLSKRWINALGLVLIVCALSCRAHCEDISVAVLLQQSPIMAGTVSPNPGVHHFTLNSEVVLTAIARPGYEFVYWLGEVTNPTSSRTTAYMNKPKIIIAVFQQSQYQIAIPTVGGAGQSGGARATGDLFGSAVDLYQPQDVSGGSSGTSGHRGPSTEAKNPGPEPPELPQPPVPEPATGLLLLAGSALFLSRHRTP